MAGPQEWLGPVFKVQENLSRCTLSNASVNLEKLKSWVRIHLPADDAVRKAILSQPNDVSVFAFVELAISWDRMMTSV
jgi:hypothetical protein